MYCSNQLAQVQAVLASLDKKNFNPSPLVYWCDFILSNAALWICLIAVILIQSPIGMLFAFLVGTIFCFRISTFVYEINHSAGRLPNFKKAYDIFFGHLFKMQSSLFRNHAFHHDVKTFGTIMDPKYDDFAHQGVGRALRVFPETLVYILKMNIKLASGPFGRRIHLPSIINPRYKDGNLRGSDLVDQAYFWAIVLACSFGYLPWKFFVVLNALTVSVWLFDFIHLISAHGYDGFKRNLGLQGQVEDSNTIVGAWYSECWSPLGLRYHALHHLRPDIPYHSMAKVHKILIRNLPDGHFYMKTIRKSGAAVWSSYLSKVISNSKLS